MIERYVMPAQACPDALGTSNVHAIRCFVAPTMTQTFNDVRTRCPLRSRTLSLPLRDLPVQSAQKPPHAHDNAGNSHSDAAFRVMGPASFLQALGAGHQADNVVK